MTAASRRSRPLRFEVDVPGGTLHGAVVGSGAPLLVLHGGPGLSDYSESLLPELAGWRAITYHQRGPVPSLASGPYTVERHVADALAVLDHHRVDSGVVLGHSWGSFLACCLTAAAPQRVAGLVLVDGLGVVGDGGLAEFSRRRLQSAQPEVLRRLKVLDARLAELDGTRSVDGVGGADSEGDAIALEAFALMWPTYFAEPERAPSVPNSLRVHRRCSDQTMESVAAVLADTALADRLRSFTGPVEVIFGEVSPMPASASRDTAALFSCPVTTPLPGAGHLPWVEQPGVLAQALTRLAHRLARIPGQRAPIDSRTDSSDPSRRDPVDGSWFLEQPTPTSRPSSTRFRCLARPTAAHDDLPWG